MIFNLRLRWFSLLQQLEFVDYDRMVPDEPGRPSLCEVFGHDPQINNEWNDECTKCRAVWYWPPGAMNVVPVKGTA